MPLTLGPGGTSNENSIKTMVRRLCKADPTNGDSYTTDAIITAYANQELQTLPSESRSVKKTNVGSESLTVANQRVYALPSDCLEVTDISVGPSKAQIKLKYRSTAYFNVNGGPGWRSRTGQPYYYYFDDQGTYPTLHQVGLFPVPGTSGQLITIEYIGKGNTLVNNTDVPLIDYRLDWALVYGVASKIMELRRDPAFADIYRQRYEYVLQKFMDSGRGGREPVKALNHYDSEGDDY